MNQYLSKYSYAESAIESAPEPGLGLVVVVTSRGCPNPEACLQALWMCEHPGFPVEVVMVIYASESDDEATFEANLDALKYGRDWALNQNQDRLKLHVLFEHSLPERHCGVGLARKIGMDEAVKRLYLAGKDAEGIIASIDVNAICESNYFTALALHFAQQRRTPACSVRFKLNTLGAEYPPRAYLGALYYELHLRYYNTALRATGFPNAYHILGSALAVRSSAYQKEGGMSRRQRSADFFFLLKMIALGSYTELNSTCVHLDARPDPYATDGPGKAITQYLGTTDSRFYSYNPQAFRYLHTFFKNIPEFYLAGARLVTLGGVIPYVMIDFLNAYFFDERIEEIRNNSSTFYSFERRFYRWFNGYMVQKFVHFVRDNAHPNIPVERAALELLRSGRWPESQQVNSLNDLLEAYRKIEMDGMKPYPSIL